MQNPSSPFANGAFLTSRANQVVWKMRHDGSRELTLPHTCRLKRYTAQQASRCLQNKHLLFIGDSLTRYQYLSLAYFLEHKHWPPRYPSSGYTPCTQFDQMGKEACSSFIEPNVCCEYDWDNWAHGQWPGFMQSLGGGTDGALFHGRMEAQSVRAKPPIERYQYVSSDENNDGRVRVSLLLEFGWVGSEPYYGWNLTGCANTGTCRYTPESYEKKVERNTNKDWDWEYPNVATAFQPGSSLHNEYLDDTNYVFYNRGLWGALQQDKAETIMNALRNMTRGTNNRCFFKSTTGCGRSVSNSLDSIEYNDVRKTTFDSGCEYFDIGHVTQEFGRFIVPDKSSMASSVAMEYRHVFWDSVHYVSVLYFISCTVVTTV